jgi:hypothetical protein
LERVLIEKARNFFKSALSLAGVSGLANMFRPQPLHSLLDERIKPLAAFTQMMHDFLSHARVPEFGEVIGNPGDSRFVLLGLEEFPDLIGHIDEFLGKRRVMRHDVALDQ